MDAALSEDGESPRRESVSAWMTWALALTVALDYFDHAAFTYFASHIAGGVSASASELVWASSAYAITSVLGIVQQQWWVERLGYRRYITASLLLFAVTAALAGIAESAFQLMLARGLQGYAMGPMLSACRIALQRGTEGPQRAKGLRKFLSLILLGSALAPLVGGYLVVQAGWSALFIATAVAAMPIALLAYVALPDLGVLPQEEHGESHAGPYILFAIAISALQISMQQVRFELFASSPSLVVSALAGIAALSWFAHHQWHHQRPLLRLHAVRQQTFRTGLVMYVCFYYANNALNFLTSRFLEGGLGYPVDKAGQLVGATALLALPLVFIYFRVSPLLPRKKWLILPGYVVAFLVCAWFTAIPPNTSQDWLVPPLFFRGALLLTMALPVASVTFSMFEADDYSHAYRLKNVVKQLTLSFSTATFIALEQHRSQLHYSRLAENVSIYNPNFNEHLDRLATSLVIHGGDLARARMDATAQIYRELMRQVDFLSIQDGYVLLAIVIAFSGVFALAQRSIR